MSRLAFTVAELAQRAQARVRGDGSVRISDVATLEDAGPADIAYVASGQYHKYLGRTRAGAVILKPADAGLYAGTALLAEDPQLCFARVAALLHPRPPVVGGVHPSAAVDPGATVDASAWVGPNAVIECGAVVGARAYIGAACYIGKDARVGADSYLTGRVTVLQGCVLGARCILHPGAVIGSDGFGYAREGAAWVKISQLGRAIVGDDVEIGANATIDRGALGDTVIGDGVKLDNLVHIAHNVRVGEHTAMAACVGVAGSAVIGKRCAIGGGVGILGHLEITDDVHITATSLVSGSITEPGMYSSTTPAEPAARWRRNLARLRQLDGLARRLKKLEEKIQQLFPGEKP